MPRGTGGRVTRRSYPRQRRGIRRPPRRHVPRWCSRAQLDVEASRLGDARGTQSEGRSVQRGGPVKCQHAYRLIAGFGEIQGRLRMAPRLTKMNRENLRIGVLQGPEHRREAKVIALNLVRGQETQERLADSIVVDFESLTRIRDVGISDEACGSELSELRPLVPHTGSGRAYFSDWTPENQDHLQHSPRHSRKLEEPFAEHLVQSDLSPDRVRIQPGQPRTCMPDQFFDEKRISPLPCD